MVDHRHALVVLAKSDHRIDRCGLKGAIGNALQGLSCAAGYNIRWLLRAIAAPVAKAAEAELLAPTQWALYGLTQPLAPGLPAYQRNAGRP